MKKIFRLSALATTGLVLAGCASVNVDQAVRDTNDTTNTFTQGKLELSRTEQQGQARAKLSSELLAKALDSKFRGFAISQVVPYPWSEADATASTFRNSIVAATTVTYASYEGYINGLILLEGLKRCGQTLTRRTFHAAIRSIRGQVAGLQVDFTSESPTASRFVEIVHVTRQGRFVR